MTIPSQTVQYRVQIDPSLIVLFQAILESYDELATVRTVAGPAGEGGVGEVGELLVITTPSLASFCAEVIDALQKELAPVI